ncbi:hypothetical protein KBC75_02100 [Candidatus Shapirobacteria bacterium]|nr:hypothetical protein [Candidatus Shapirobacteria bacterium]
MDIVAVFDVIRFQKNTKYQPTGNEREDFAGLAFWGLVVGASREPIPRGVRVDLRDLNISIEVDENVATVFDSCDPEPILLNEKKTFHVVGVRVAESLFARAVVVRVEGQTVDVS